MGLFDCRCLITDVSLQAARAVVVVLGQTEDSYYPVSLGVKGLYNRVGGIDQPQTVDANMRLILRYFQALQASGDLEIENPGNIYELVEELSDYIDWDGALETTPGAFVYALISEKVWNSIAASEPLPSASLSELFEATFADSTEAQAIYAGSLSEVAEDLREMAAITAFVRRKGIVWSPPELPNQDEPFEMREYLEQARKAFQGEPSLLRGLDEYAFEVRAQLEDEIEEDF